MAKNHCILWFRNDLRLFDNFLLHHEALKTASHVIPVFCYDSVQDGKCGKYRRKFRDESIKCLSESLLKKLKLPLLVFKEDAPLAMNKIISKIDGNGIILCSNEVCTEEKTVEKNVRQTLEEIKKLDHKKNWKLESIIGNYFLYQPEDIPFNVYEGGLPEPFTAARNKIEGSKARVHKPLQIPSSLPPFPNSLHDLAKENSSEKNNSTTMTSFSLEKNEEDYTASIDQYPQKLEFIGGENEAWKRMETFCDTGLAEYKTLRNGSLGWKYSSKLSPYLADGSISPRAIHHRIREWEDNNGGETVHTYWMTFELLTRDYMRYFAMKHGDKIFFPHGIVGNRKRGKRQVLNNSEDNSSLKKLEHWKMGTTGVPWVDGHMRELLLTGFMSNRGRQNVASFLIHNLEVPWWWGAEHFEKYLIDHDVTANYGNWVQAAGIANPGARINRFNMIKQANDYDKDGAHARHWILELRNIQLPYNQSIHKLASLTEMPPSMRRSVGVNKVYSPPIVNLNQPANLHGGTYTTKTNKQHDRKKHGRVHQGRNNNFVTH